MLCNIPLGSVPFPQLFVCFREVTWVFPRGSAQPGSLFTPQGPQVTSQTCCPRKSRMLEAGRGGGMDIFLCSVPFNPWGSIQTVRWQSHALGTLSQFLAVACKNREAAQCGDDHRFCRLDLTAL